MHVYLISVAADVQLGGFLLWHGCWELYFSFTVVVVAAVVVAVVVVL